MKGPRSTSCALPLVAVASVVAVLSCAGSRPSGSYPPGPHGTPQRGGHAIFLREEDPDYLDPALSYGTYSAPLIETVFRTLLEYVNVPGPEGSRLVPELAESLPDVREGGRLYAFKIRREARFGAPLHRHVTAADFKYSIERLFRVGSPGVSFYQHIAGADRMLAGKDSVLSGVIARGDSLYIRLIRPDPIFLSILSISFTAPLPREVVERYPNAVSQHTVATGPFQVAEYTPRRRVLLVRNPDYWGTPAYLDTFELRLSVTPINALALIKRGLADGGFFEIPAAEYGRLRLDPLWRHQIDLRDGLSTWYVFMNVRVRPFNDPRVRQAVSWAIDRRALVKAWSGKAIPAGEFLPHGMPGARPLGRYQGPDTARARRLLREAGYPNGFDVEWVTPLPTFYSRGERIIAQLREVGIRGRLQTMERGIFFQRLQGGLKEFPGTQIILHGARIGGSWSFWYEGHFKCGGFNVRDRICVKDLDAKFDQYEKSINPAERKKLAEEIQRGILENHYLVPVFRHAFVNAIGPRIAAQKWQDVFPTITTGYAYPWEDLKVKE